VPDADHGRWHRDKHLRLHEGPIPAPMIRNVTAVSLRASRMLVGGMGKPLLQAHQQEASR